MIIHEQILSSVHGFVLSGVSTLALWVAQTPEVAAMPGLTGWMQLGGTAGLIGGLAYGCVTLWKALQTQRSEMNTERKEAAQTMADERAAMNLAVSNERTLHEADKAALNAEIRGELKAQTNKLIEVLNKLDPDTR